MPNQAIYRGIDSLAVADTVYGIENEDLIPIRHTEVKPKTAPTNNILFDPSPLNSGTENWQVLLLLIAVLLLGIVKAFSNNRYRLGLKALINYSVAQEIIREEQVFFHRSNIFLTIAHTLTFSLFLYQLKIALFNQSNNVAKFNEFLIIVVAIVITYFAKYLFSKLLFFVFNNTSTSVEYIFNVSLYNNLLGGLLIPILCVDYFTEVPFSQLLIYTVVPISLLVFLFRLIRLVAIGRSIGLLYVYIFLYICSLEILPLVVLYRIFIR